MELRSSRDAGAEGQWDFGMGQLWVEGLGGGKNERNEERESDGK
jgi:hypothetical protein